MSKRIISIFLCCALCSGFLILPAAASSIGDDGINDAGTQYLNYLIETDYQVLTDVWSNISEPAYSFENVNRFAFKWYPESALPGSYMLFAVQANSKPSAISCRFASGSYVAATYEGAIPSAGNLYFYRISMPDQFDFIEIFGRYDNAYTGSIRIASCFGVRNLLSVYDRAEFSYTRLLMDPNGGEYTDTVNQGVKFFPYTPPFTLNDQTDQLKVDFSIRCDGDRFNTSAVGKVYFLFNTLAENFYFTASLVAKDSNVSNVNNIKVVLSKDANWASVNSYSDIYTTLHTFSAYQATIDLTGYDMANYDLQIFVSVEDYVFNDLQSDLSEKILGFSFRSITYVPTILSNPWYKPITDVLHNGFDYVVSSFGGITGAIQYQTSRIQTFINSMTTSINNYFNNLANRLTSSLEELLGYSSDQQDNINSSVDQNQQQQEQVQDQGESMKDQIDQIEQAENEMLQVPEIDPGTLQLGTLIPQSGITMMTNVMVTLTNNNYAATIILVVVSLALVAIMVL